jgi:hypothetical protein
MKIDIDSILYIVITIAILAISGLGSRRRKKAEMEARAAAAKAAAAGSGSEDIEAKVEYPDEDTYPETGPETGQKYSNPFERLEQLLEDGDVFSRQAPAREPAAGKSSGPRVVSLEGESLEKTSDEEEEILSEIENRKTEVKRPGLASVKGKIREDDEKADIASLSLFEGMDDVKKAIIYSEILSRRY